MREGRSTDVLVIGAGFLGLATAWAIGERKTGTKVLVVDSGDFACGGSGRNGAGIRLQWARDFNIQLCKDSLEVFESAEDLLEYPGGIDLQQVGYLILAHSAEALTELRRATAIQSQFGVPSEVVSAEDCARIQPGLSLEGLHGGAFCDRDGTACPFKWLDALQRASIRLGAEVRYGCRVIGILSDGTSFQVKTDRGDVSAGQVVLCTDWAAPELLRPLGIELPVSQLSKEALVTEPVGRLVDTVLMASEYGLGIKQLKRGNVILTRADSHSARGFENTTTWLEKCARSAVKILPRLTDANVLRSWGGAISMTPDMQPIIGETEIQRLYVGVSAYKGFMISPQVGRIMAELVLDGSSEHVAAKALVPSRFAAGKLASETLTI